MIFRVLDIETVPDPEAWTPGAPKWSWALPPTHDHRHVCDTVLPFDMCLVREDPFPPPHAQRVVAISWVDVAFDPRAASRYRLAGLHTSCLWSAPRDEVEDRRLEARLLREFGEGATAAAQSGGGLCLVTWNGRTFDLPVIALRSFRHGVPCPWYYGDRDVRYRYSTEGHLDLMDFFSDYGACRSMKLHDAARLVGLPGKTGDVTGASVSDAYESTLHRVAGPVLNAEVVREGVAGYCLQDSIQTALLFLRSRYHVGKLTAEAYHECLGTFEDSPEVRAAIQLDWRALRVEVAGAASPSVEEVLG